jgi:hypothetical protein
MPFFSVLLNSSKIIIIFCTLYYVRSILITYCYRLNYEIVLFVIENFHNIDEEVRSLSKITKKKSKVVSLDHITLADGVTNKVN